MCPLHRAWAKAFMFPPNLVGFFKSKKVSTWFVFSRLRFHLLEQKKKKKWPYRWPLNTRALGVTILWAFNLYSAFCSHGYSTYPSSDSTNLRPRGTVLFSAEKNSHISESLQVKPMLKGQLYSFFNVSEIGPRSQGLLINAGCHIWGEYSSSQK